jgi:hypothetical protein
MGRRKERGFSPESLACTSLYGNDVAHAVPMKMEWKGMPLFFVGDDGNSGHDLSFFCRKAKAFLGLGGFGEWV